MEDGAGSAFNFDEARGVGSARPHPKQTNATRVGEKKTCVGILRGLTTSQSYQTRACVSAGLAA